MPNGISKATYLRCVIVLNLNHKILAKWNSTKPRQESFHFQRSKRWMGLIWKMDFKLKGEVVMRADELGVPGSHNVECSGNDCSCKVRGGRMRSLKETLSGLWRVNTVFNMWTKFVSNSTMIVNRPIFQRHKKALSGFDNKVKVIAG